MTRRMLVAWRILQRASAASLLVLALSFLKPSRAGAVCGASVSVPTNYASIQAAVNSASGTTVAGDYCILVAPGSYAEQISFSSHTNIGRVTISTTGASAATINPPISSTAAFVISDSNVTILGFNIAPTSPTTYGVFVASPGAVLSGLNVSGGASITLAGIALSSSTAVISNSTVTLQGALPSSTALLIQPGASSNTITQSYFSDGGGYGAYIQGGYNTIAQSTLISNGAGGAALYVGSSSNAITQDILSSPNGVGLWMDHALNIPNNNNTVSQSTITSGAAGQYALYVNGVTLVTVSNSYIQGSTAVYIAGSTSTVINSSVVVATNTAGSGIFFSTANVGLSLTSNTITGGSQGTGIYMGLYNASSINLSSNTIQGARSGLFISTQTAGAVLSISSMTFQSLPAGTTAINFGGGIFVSTFSNVNFADTNIAVNVNASPLGATSSITMSSSTGTRSGPCYANDPAHFVSWPGNTNCGSGGGGMITPMAFTGVGANALTANWASSFAPGTTYYAFLSTAANFSGTPFPSTSTNTFAAFTGLNPATLYYAEVSTTNAPSTSMAQFTNLGLVATTGGGGTISSAPFSGVTSNSLTANWSSTFAGGTTYYAVLSTGALPNSFVGNFFSLGTAFSAFFTGLTPSTPYFGQVSTNSATGPFTSLGSTTTLAGGGGGGTITPMAFTGVGINALTANWNTTFPGGTTYYAFLSTTSNFQGQAMLLTTTNNFATFAGLNPAILYFAEVSTSNVPAWNLAQFTQLGSTTTANGTGSSFILTVTPAGTGMGNVISAPAGINCGNGGTFCSVAFSSNTVVTLTAAPGSGSTFAGWTGAGCSGMGSCVVSMTAAQYVTASFNLSGTGFSLSVGYAGTGIGNVMSSPLGINCGNGGTSCMTTFASGSSVTLTATPGFGSTFSGWSGGGCASTGTCAVTMNAAQTVTAFFNSSGGYNLFVSTGGNGAGNVMSAPAGVNCGNGGMACVAAFASSATVTLTAAPSANSVFAGWSGGGCGGTGSCTVVMNATQTVMAAFNNNSGSSYFLTISSGGSGVGNVTSTPAGINCGNGGFNCSVAFSSNTAVILTAAPASGSVFGGWVGGGCGAATTCSLVMSAPQYITANFNPSGSGYPLTISFAGNGMGNVTSNSGGINCGNGGTICSTTFAAGTLVTLTAAPAAGSTFTGWTGAGCGGMGTCTVTLNAAQNVTANFNTSGFVLTVTNVGLGVGNVMSGSSGINCGNGGTSCAVIFSSNTLVTLTAAPASGSTFAGWNGGGCSGVGSCTVLMSSTQTVAAIFNNLAYTLTVSTVGSGAGGNVASAPPGINCGNGGLACSVAFSSNTLVTLTASTATGTMFSGWSGGGCAGTGSCVVTVSAAQYVTAFFDPAVTGGFGLQIAMTGAGLGSAASTPAGINCGNGQTGCFAVFPSATLVTLTAAAAPGSVFSGWTGGGCGGMGSCTVTMSVAQYVTATFVPSALSLSVGTTGGGAGNVASNPSGINCGNGGMMCATAFSSGTLVMLTAMPANGSVFGGWNGAGCSGTGSCAVTMSSGQSVSAAFNQSSTGATGGFTLNVANSGSGNVTSAPAGINCGNGGTSCTANFALGTPVALTETPGSGAAFAGWSGGGCGGLVQNCTVMMSVTQYVSATFNTPVLLTVGNTGSGAGNVTSAPVGINCGNGGMTCATGFGSNTMVTLTAAAVAGSVFAGWSGGGCSGTGSCSVAMSAAQNVTATFNAVVSGSGYALSVGPTGTGIGSIESSPTGINCGANCAAVFPANASVTLTAYAGAGSIFGGWSGAGCGGIGNCTVTMSAAQSVSALFNPSGGGFNLTLTNAGSGVGNVVSSPVGINCGNGGTSCSVAFSSNTLVTLTAAPAAGSFFAGWNVPGCAGTGPCTVTMSAAQTVMATFTGVVTVGGTISYGGAQFGPVRVEFWSDSGFSYQLIAQKTLPGGAAPYPYSIPVPGGGFFFARAFMDINGNFVRDPSEPFGFYAPRNQGPEAVATPSYGSVSSVNFSIADPGASAAGVAGEGSASLNVSSVAAGSMFNLTATYVSRTGIQTGGKIGVILPPGFYPQSVTATSTSAATLSPVSYAGQAVYTTVSGSLLPGQNVLFNFSSLFAPCMVSTQTMTVASAQNGSVAPQPLFSGSPSLYVAPGAASMFQLSNPYFSVTRSVLSDPQALQARDACGNAAPILGGPQTVVLRAKTYSYAGGFADDATIGFSTAASVQTVGNLSVVFAVGQSTRSIYVLAASTGMRNIEMFSNLAGPTTFYAGFSAQAGNALGNVSVSTAAFILGQKTATIVANGDPTAANQAFVNFTMADPNQSWHVLVSSSAFVQGLAPVAVWERWGYGQPALGSISWDGRYLSWINNGIRVPSGTYYIRVESGYGGVHDDTLSAVVNTPQLAGQILDAASTPHLPLSGARLNIYGPFGGGSVSSDQLGSYVLAGLGAGAYNLFLTRDSYLDASLSFTLDSTGKVSTFTALSNAVVASTNSSGGLDFLMIRAPYLFVVPSVGVGFSTSSADRWGSIQLQNSDPTQPSVFGPMRLPAGTTTFDDGGQWNAGSQSFVVGTSLKFKVAAGTYTVQAAFSGFSPSNATVYVGPNGAMVNLPPFASKSSISGLVAAPSNPAGMFVSVNAVSLSSSASAGGGFGGVYLAPGMTVGTYTVANLDAGNYALRANAPGFVSATLGPIAVPAASVVTQQNFPTFGSGASISGSARINADTTGQTLQLSVNAWAPGSFSFGSTVTYAAGGASGLSVPYQITGLSAGTTYQIYAQLIGAGNLSPVGGMPLSGAAPGTVNFTYAANSGAITGVFVLPPGANDFSQVDLYAQVTASARPERVGYAFSVISSTHLPGFACTADQSGAPSGNCPVGNSSATFQLTGLDTESYDIMFHYKATGQNSDSRVSVVSGSTTTLTADLRAQTYSISGSIVNQISNPLFNTNANIFNNAPDVPLMDAGGNFVPISSLGVPRSTSSLARVVAVRQDINSFNAAISTSFNPVTSYVGFMTAAGTYTISNLPSGIYAVRTANLSACATCPTAVPAASQIVSVLGANQTGVNFTLSDGFSISGAISLDGGIQDADVFSVSVLNRRQEVVRSTTVYLGGANLGLTANSVAYGFSNIPANDFYTLTVAGLLTPARYAGRPIKFPDPSLSPNGLQSGLSGQNIVMQRAAYIVGRLRDSNTGALITADNAAVLAPNFSIAAVANPWVQGGFVVAGASVAGRPIQGDGYFHVGPLIPAVAYDLNLAQTNWDPAYLSQGSQNYAPVTLSGITPQAGEVRDVGVVGLSQGQSLSGTVRQSGVSGVPLGNIKIMAVPSFGNSNVTVQTYTNPQGRYTVWVSSSLSNEYDITAAPSDGNLSSNGLVYGQVTLRNVGLQSATTADFFLSPLTQSATGQVIVEDAASGGALSYPFGPSRGFPVAAVNLQPRGVVPTLDPLGDIEAATDQSGNFHILGLSTGTYSLKATSLGYAVFNATVATTATSFRIFTGADIPANILPGNVLTLRRGATLTGRLLKSDGTPPNDGEVGGIVAANFASSEYAVGSVDIDPTAKTVNSYSISGFKTGVNYTIVVLPKDGLDEFVFPPEGSAINFSVSEATSTKSVGLTYVVASVDCHASAKSLGNSQFQVKIDCSKPLRNTLASDNDLDRILAISTVTSQGAAFTLPNGAGQLLGSDKSMSSSRRTITAVYRAATGETNFSLRLRAYSSAVDFRTGGNFYVDKVFDFYAGLDSNVSQKIVNIQGGSLDLEPTTDDETSGLSERAKIDVQAGAFAEGADDASAVVVASETVSLSLSKGKDQRLAKTLALATLGYVPAGSGGGRAARLDVLGNVGAFPPEMAAAMKAYRGLTASTAAVGGINPLSSFYSIFLPAGIRHQLKKAADLTLSFTLLASPGQNPDNINVWYYNPAGGRYVREANNRRLDTVNQTITVSVDHLSTFVVLGSTPIFTSTSTFTGDDMQAYNFPNPADCIQHAYLSGGLLPANALSSWQGTMIRFGLPGPAGAGAFAPATIKIYDMAGELVKTMNPGVLQGGNVYYQNWDCTNGGDAPGRTVASGVYIGQVLWNGKSKFFKMAIIKGSGL